MSLSKFTTLAAIAALSITLFGCAGGGSSSEVRLQGAGATFPNPLYQKWISEYGKAHANVRSIINRSDPVAASSRFRHAQLTLALRMRR